MNDLLHYFNTNKGRLIHKYMHYFDVYERHFARFRNQEVVILEIGVSHGGSLQMWRDYFGPRAKIYGIDVNPECRKLEEEHIKIFIGSQSDKNFLREIKKSIPPIDILIDDGGHNMRQQIVSYEELFPHVKENGIYLIEDLHTSYWLRYGGGHKRKGTFIEYSKNFIDALQAFHSRQKSLRVNAFTTSVDSLHYYDSILVIEKKKREEPHYEMTGIPSLTKPSETTSTRKAFQKKGVDFLIKYTNLILRFFRLPGFIWK